MSTARPNGGMVPPLANPYVWRVWDDAGRQLQVSFTWVPVTRLLLGIATVRDDGMAWNRVLIGLGSDGSPDTTPWKLDVPVGNTDLTSVLTGLLVGLGLTTIDNVLATQITVTTV